MVEVVVFWFIKVRESIGESLFTIFGVTAEYPSIGSYNPEKAGYMDTQLSPANALRTRNTYMSYLPCVC